MTTQHPTTQHPIAPSLTAHHRAARIRSLPAAGFTIALVLLIILAPDAPRVHAAAVFGALRAPGEPAFTAAHRGDRAVAPENTLPALQAALDSTFGFVEIDVQLSADGVPVLIHDVSVDRTTDGEGLVAELSLAQLKALDAGSWYDAAFAGTRIPTLEEFLAILETSDKTALIELKGFWSVEEVQEVSRLLHAYSAQERVVFASFNFATLGNVADVSSRYPLVIIRRELPADPVALARLFGAIAILTAPVSLEADPTAVTTMHEAGLGLLVYTLNSEKRWSEALALGVDGIVTDRPSSLDSWLAATAPGT